MSETGDCIADLHHTKSSYAVNFCETMMLIASKWIPDASSDPLDALLYIVLKPQQTHLLCCSLSLLPGCHCPVQLLTSHRQLALQAGQLVAQRAHLTGKPKHMASVCLCLYV